MSTIKRAFITTWDEYPSKFGGIVIRMAGHDFAIGDGLKRPSSPCPAIVKEIRAYPGGAQLSSTIDRTLVEVVAEYPATQVLMSRQLYTQHSAEVRIINEPLKTPEVKSMLPTNDLPAFPGRDPSHDLTGQLADRGDPVIDKYFSELLNCWYQRASKHENLVTRIGTIGTLVDIARCVAHRIDGVNLDDDLRLKFFNKITESLLHARITTDELTTIAVERTKEFVEMGIPVTISIGVPTLEPDRIYRITRALLADPGKW